MIPLAKWSPVSTRWILPWSSIWSHCCRYFSTNWIIVRSRGFLSEEGRVWLTPPQAPCAHPSCNVSGLIMPQFSPNSPWLNLFHSPGRLCSTVTLAEIFLHPPCPGRGTGHLSLRIVSNGENMSKPTQGWGKQVRFPMDRQLLPIPKQHWG